MSDKTNVYDFIHKNSCGLHFNTDGFFNVCASTNNTVIFGIDALLVLGSVVDIVLGLSTTFTVGPHRKIECGTNRILKYGSFFFTRQLAACLPKVTCLSAKEREMNKEKTSLIKEAEAVIKEKKDNITSLQEMIRKEKLARVEYTKTFKKYELACKKLEILELQKKMYQKSCTKAKNNSKQISEKCERVVKEGNRFIDEKVMLIAKLEATVDELENAVAEKMVALEEKNITTDLETLV